jgi:hypothetical protein
MYTRLTALAASIAVLSPAVSMASPQRVSAESCARAFAASIAAPGAAARAYKLSYRADFSSGLADFYPTEYTFTLEARNSKGGAALARAVCSTDSRGAVTGITAVPLDVKAATPAAGF